jgi:hypothetical protein
MAVVSVAFDGTRMSQAETISDGGNWYIWGTTSKPTVEVDFVYQLGSGSAAISRKISSGQGGVEFNATTQVDYTSATAVRAVLALINTTTYGLINTSVHKGAEYGIGSDGSNYYGYYLYGSFNGYPPKGGWQIILIDPNEQEYWDITNGTPALTVVDWYGWWNDITGSVKAENVVHDAICYLAKEQGLTLTRGDSTDPDGVFQDFVDYDEGTTGNRYGVVVTAEGVLNVTGWLTIGDSTGTNATVFNDTGKVVVFRNALVSAGFSGLKLYQGNSSDDIDIVDTFIQSTGRGWAKNLFDTTSDVDGTNDVITQTWAHWQDLDYVTYSKEGGTANMGLTDATDYWVAWDSTNSGWAFYTTRANAAADTSRVSLTSTGAETHSFDKVNDTRADLTVSGTSGLGADLTGCTIDNLRNITLTSVGTLDTCKITNCEQITQASGTVSDCTISLATTDDGEAFVVSNAVLNLISGNDFTFTNGHAIEYNGSAGSFSFTGNDFNGYGADGSTDAALYNNITPTTLTSYDGATNQDTTVQVYSGSTTQVAQTFTTGASPGTLSALSFYIRKNASPTGTVQAHLYATSGGAPTGTALASSETYDIADLTTSYADIDFPIQGGYALSGTTTYAFAVEYTGGDSTNRLEVGVDNSTPGHSGTGYSYSGTWSSQTWDACFYAYTAGALIINQSGGSGLTVRNATGTSTQVNNAVTIRVEVADEAGDPIENAQTSLHALETVGTITEGDEIMNKDTNASGVAEDTGFNYEGAFDPSGLDVVCDVRKSSSGTTRYFAFSQDVTIDSDGLLVFVTLIEDPIASS